MELTEKQINLLSKLETVIDVMQDFLDEVETLYDIRKLKNVAAYMLISEHHECQEFVPARVLLCDFEKGMQAIITQPLPYKPETTYTHLHDQTFTKHVHCRICNIKSTNTVHFGTVELNLTGDAEKDLRDNGCTHV